MSRGRSFSCVLTVLQAWTGTGLWRQIPGWLCVGERAYTCEFVWQGIRDGATWLWGMWHPLWPVIYQTINSESCDHNPCIAIGLLSWLVCRWRCVASAPHVHSMEPPSQWIIGVSCDQFEQATSSALDRGKRHEEWVESLRFWSSTFSAKASQKRMDPERARRRRNGWEGGERHQMCSVSERLIGWRQPSVARSPRC